MIHSRTGLRLQRPSARCFLPGVSQAGGMVQRTPASHVPLVHISGVLQQELASYQGALRDTDRQTDGRTTQTRLFSGATMKTRSKYLFPVSQVFKQKRFFVFFCPSFSSCCSLSLRCTEAHCCDVTKKQGSVCENSRVFT